MKITNPLSRVASWVTLMAGNNLFGEVQKRPNILNDTETELRIMKELGQLICTPKGKDNQMTSEEISIVIIDSLISIEVRQWFRRHLSQR
jgi:hypothetical protein